MRVVVSAGGTAGHVNPALAVVHALVAQGVEVLYAGTPDSIEQRLVAEAGIAFQAFQSRGLSRSKPWTIPATLLLLYGGRSAAKRWLAEVKPDAVATFGGYASLPVGLAAAGLRLPLLVHEQNARPGLANRVLARRADVLALTDERAAPGLRARGRMLVTGNPLRGELFESDRAGARQRLGLSPDALVLLVFGGSTGAHHLNTAMLAQAAGLLADFADLEVLHLTGRADYEWACAELAGAGIDQARWQLVEYSSRMGDAYAAADLVLSRSGATTLAELTALGKAALLIPYPYAAADEQTANAELLAAAGAAWVCADSELDGPGFGAMLRQLLADEGLRREMAEKSAGFGQPGATEHVARLVMELAGAGAAG